MMMLPLEAGHLDQVAEIETKDGDAHWSRAQFEKELSGEFRRFFVVLESDPTPTETGGQTPILAYGGYWKAGPEAQITNLVVCKESRCRGIGKRLLEFILDCARGEECVTCTLEVRLSNHHAQSLYKSLGFDSKGTRTTIYQNPVEDAVLMEKQL
jgi:ribosomal-protein-alanine N-acetyltransferase